MARAFPATELTQEDIDSNLTKFLSDRSDCARYASFDYCYNYIQSFILVADSRISSHPSIYKMLAYKSVSIWRAGGCSAERRILCREA